MKANQAEHSVATACRVLGVSTSGYYAWLARPVCDRERTDAELTELIARIWEGSDRTYGAPRVHAELADAHGVHVGRKRVARLMRRAGMSGVSRRRKRPVTTRRGPGRPAPDLVDRDFSASRPDALWVADIT